MPARPGRPDRVPGAWRAPEAWGGLLFLLVLLLLAWRHHVERMACYDPAFFSWLIIDSGHPEAVLGRLGSWPTQVLPLAVLHLGGGLESVLRAYSVSFILLYLVLFLFVLLVLKDRVAAVAFPLVLGPAFRHAFYYSTAELYQGLALAVVLWALLRRLLETGDRGRPAQWGWLVVLTAWLSLYHQLLVFPLLFMLGYECLRRGLWTDRAYLLGAALLLALFAARIVLLTNSTYEQDRILDPGTFLTNARWIRWLPSTRYLLEHGMAFKALMVLAASVTLALAWTRRWALLAWTGGLSIGFLVLILVTYHDGESPLMYENYYTLFGFFGALPFADLFFDAGDRWKRARQVLFFLLLVLSARQIVQGRTLFTEKVRFADRITSQLRAMGVRKAIADKDHFPWPYGWVSWAAPFETALVSALHGPDSVVTVFYVEDPGAFKGMLDEPGLFLGPEWEPVWFGTQNLRQRMFRFPEEAPYVPITTMRPGGLTATVPRTGLELVPHQAVVHAGRERIVVTEIQVHNRSDDTLHARTSRDEPLRLVCRTMGPGGATPVAERWTELEMDVAPWSSLRQGLVIDRPAQRGRHVVEVDIPGGPTGSLLGPGRSARLEVLVR